MFPNFIYALPEIVQLIGVLHLYILHLNRCDTAAMYARTARFWLLVSLFFSVLFYNRSINPLYFERNAFTLLFILLADTLAYVMLGLSALWFAAENRCGCKYYVLILCASAGINLLVASVNLVSALFGYILLIYINYRLLGISYEKLPSEAASRYLGVSALIILLFAAGFGYICCLSDTALDYASLQKLTAENKDSFSVFAACIGLLIPFLYSLGIAPFHMMAEEKQGKAILPVSHYFALVVPWAFWGAFIRLSGIICQSYSTEIAPVYMFFAVCSAGFGSIGANARINLHRIFAHCSIYHFGLVLALLSQCRAETDFSAFVYLLAYMCGLSGIYLVLYGLKSHGEYLSAVTSLSGLAETRPYTTGALLISLFSIIGFPPLAGFLGQFNLAAELIHTGDYGILLLFLLFLLILAKSFLEIIKTAYFDRTIKIFDTENRLVLFYTVLNMTVIAVLAFNPFHIMEKIKDMFYVIFI